MKAESLAKIDFGQPEAEHDHHALEKSFYEAESWKRISENGGIPFIIGRKGAGKSAIATRFEILAKQKNNCCFIRFVPSDFRHVEIRDLLSNLVNKTTSWQYIYRKVWEGIILGQIVRHFLECKQSHNLQTAQIELKRELQQFQRECGFYVSALGDALSDVITKYVRDASKKTDALSQVELRKMLEPYDWKPLTTALQQHLKSAPNVSSKIFIAIDGLDEHWDTSEPSLFFLAELLAVTKVFTAKFGNSIQFIICLRDNIFRALVDTKSIEYDKIESLIIYLEWNAHSLIELISKRVSPTAKKIESAVSELKELLPETVQETNIEEYLGRNILQRPRDYVNFFRMLQAECGSNARAGEGHIEDTIAKYSANRLIDLENEFGLVYPGISKCISALHFLPDTFSKETLLEELNTLCLKPSFRSEVPDLILNYGQPLLLARILMSIGVVGSYNSESHAIRFVHEFSESRVNALWEQSQMLGLHPVYRAKRPAIKNILDVYAKNRIAPVDVERPTPAILTHPPDYLPEKDSLHDLEKHSIKTGRKCSDLIASLAAIDRGQPHFRRFEEWVKDVLSLCFIGDLLNAQEQIVTVDGNKKFEIIFDIIGTEPPWLEIKNKHHTHRLLVECKNTDEPSDADINKLVRDMNALDVGVAILAYRGLLREPKGKLLEYQRAAYTNSGRKIIILALSEVFLIQCLNKESNLKCRNNLNKLWRDHVERWLTS